MATGGTLNCVLLDAAFMNPHRKCVDATTPHARHVAHPAATSTRTAVAPHAVHAAAWAPTSTRGVYEAIA